MEKLCHSIPPISIYEVLHAAEAKGVQIPKSVDQWWQNEGRQDYSQIKKNKDYSQIKKNKDYSQTQIKKNSSFKPLINQHFYD